MPRSRDSRRPHLEFHPDGNGTEVANTTYAYRADGRADLITSGSGGNMTIWGVAIP